MNQREGVAPEPVTHAVDAQAIVSLALASDPSFLQALEAGGITQDDARRGLREALKDATSDIHLLDIERIDGMVSGIACASPSSELAARRLVTLRHIMRAAPGAPGLRQALAAFSRGLPAHELGGLYLSRVAVATHARGMGIGSRLMARFEERALREADGVTTLHVAVNNPGALAFYRYRGYSVIESGISHHLLRLEAKD